jgi:3-methyladenine DNA glycosylase/8-oxoguanine DNA glycosylase
VVAKLAARSSLRAAIDEVASRDSVLADLVARVGPIRHRPRDPDGPFVALVRAIVFQQLAGRAAQAIYGRVRATVGDTLSPEALNAVSDADLRAAGLSANKLASLRDLSAKVLDGTVVLSRTSRRSDRKAASTGRRFRLPGSIGARSVSFHPRAACASVGLPPSRC